MVPIVRQRLSRRSKTEGADARVAGPRGFFDNQENILAVNGLSRDESCTQAAVARSLWISLVTLYRRFPSSLPDPLPCGAEERARREVGRHAGSVPG